MVVPSAALDRVMPQRPWEAAPPAVEPCDLQRAWCLLHRPHAPALHWEQRMLLLSGLFQGRSSAWVHALEARLEALRHEAAQRGKAPGEQAFSQASRAPLADLGGQPRFVEGSCCW